MKVDMTIFVQAINFFIAYSMLDRLLVRSGVAQIIDQRKEFQTLEGKRVQEEAVLKKYQSIKEASWRECREYFKMHVPSSQFLDQISYEKDMPVKLKEIPKNKLKEITGELVNQLIQKV